MASAKDTPRQKMIGMMYLVLTALLALNVSKDILDAFIVVNKGLETTNSNFTDRNDALYSLFDLAKSVDPIKVTPNWKSAQDVKKESASLIDYIDKLQKKLISKSDGIEQSKADTIQMSNIENKENYDTPTNILIGNSEDGSAGVSRELKNKLNDFKSKLTNYILPQDRTKVKVGINTEDPKHNSENENWEVYNFYNRPLVATLTILSKIKNDVKNAEATTVDYLLKLVDVGNLKFDTVAAKVIPQSNYVMLGEEYKADIFLAAFNKTKNPEINVGDYNETSKTFNGTSNTIRVERGLGKYNINTTKEGIVDYSGTVKVVAPDGKEIVFPFKSEYIVAKPALTVAAESMNLVYRGLDNPISVSVPGIPNEKLTVTATNAILINKGNGKYIVKPIADGEVKVNVFADLENGEKRNMGIQVLRVKRIPKPEAKIGSIIIEGKMSKAEFDVQSIIQAYYLDFGFQANCFVKSFDMSYETNGVIGTVSVKGNNINDELKKVYRQLRKNSRVYFENIKATGPDGLEVSLSPLTIKVK
ncbi:MAG: gliding motility protein GldM [Bacteroidetes bacterium]|nr:gliding motility protein GldM [Bacteroidota bacterium]